MVVGYGWVDFVTDSVDFKGRVMRVVLHTDTIPLSQGSFDSCLLPYPMRWDLERLLRKACDAKAIFNGAFLVPAVTFSILQSRMAVVDYLSDRVFRSVVPYRHPIFHQATL